ncbi:hypothetical protein EIP91_004603 [Steccherinum ochraceum]|uniref:Chitin-binding type-4 domain-containing protein n=1 Tax=Steccherinum ochraceum TaxID=92696 RepID=A0A4R0RNX0_9APHY|nr:hypothetical protein EIP91_004603 [Steccherinum ochraceum]
MLFITLAFISCVQLLQVNAHASIWHPSMWGFNVTDKTYSYDNRPVTPLVDYTFDQWWFHGHLDHPPHKDDFFELPAGQTVTTEIACNKGATSFFASSEGGSIIGQNGVSPDDPCPGSPMAEYHTTGPDDLKGCSLAIAYKSDVTQVQPEDFTVFSVNQTCVFHRFTDFQVPAAMPPCPPGGCICAWFWIHSQDSGGEQNYMNGFQCNITNSASTVPVAKPQVPRRCGAENITDTQFKPEAPGNCTYGAKQPFYWFQSERNNMFEGTYSPPFYLDLYNFKDGAQNDIFENSYPSGIPPPSANSTVVPTPVLFGASATASVAPSASSVSPASATSSQVSSVASSSSASASTTPSPSATSSSSPAFSSTHVSVVTSTSVVVSTQVITVTASAAAPTSPPAASAEPGADSSTVTEYSFAFTTVTASPPAITPSSSSSDSASTSSDPANVRAAGSSVASNAAAPTIDLDLPTITPASAVQNANTTNTNERLVDIDALAIHEASVANLTAPTPSAVPAAFGITGQTCKAKSSDSSTNLSKRSTSFLVNIPGLNRHRKWKRQPSLWQLLSPIPF